MYFLEKILANYSECPDAIAVSVIDPTAKDEKSYSYKEILEAAFTLRSQLQRDGDKPAPRVGLLMANSPEYIVADLAILISRATQIQLPLAFSAQQAMTGLHNCDYYLVDREGLKVLRQWQTEVDIAGTQDVKLINIDELLRAKATPPVEPSAVREEFICKIVHTSGTTNTPKGVRIRSNGLSALLTALHDKVSPEISRRYLSVLPLSLLIEQVAAIYLTLMAGGNLVLLAPHIKLLGTEGALAKDFIPYLKQALPTAMMVPPAFVEALHARVLDLQSRCPKEDLCLHLFGRDEPPFLACGGAPVSLDVLKSLYDAGIPIYEGYGLSENSSVVSWNVPNDVRLGTVGRPLDHVSVRVSKDHELLIKSSSLFAGYIGSDPSVCLQDEQGWLRTGDLAEIDGDGFIRILGRKKNVAITAAGRNLSPEWVESQYKSLDFVHDAVIFANNLEQVYGFLILDEVITEEEALTSLRRFGESKLSEVDRIGQFFLLHHDPRIYKEYFTVTGRPIRTKIWELVRTNLIQGASQCKIA